MNVLENQKTYLLLDDLTKDVLLIVVFDQSITHQGINEIINLVKNNIENWTVEDMIDELFYEFGRLVTFVKDFDRVYI